MKLGAPWSSRWLAGLALAGAAACGEPAAPYVGPPGPQGLAVAVRDFFYDPTPKTVARGASVTWRNQGPSAHTVTADDSSFFSGVRFPGEVYVRVFEEQGTYAYHCSLHPTMRGAIVVQ